MDVARYLVVVEYGSYGAAQAYDIRIVDAYTVTEACRQVLIETYGRHGGSDARVVLVGPPTRRYKRIAKRLVRELTLQRMPAVGMVA